MLGKSEYIITLHVHIDPWQTIVRGGREYPRIIASMLHMCMMHTHKLSVL